jgi:hypothetical protein
MDNKENTRAGGMMSGGQNKVVRVGGIIECYCMTARSCLACVIRAMSEKERDQDPVSFPQTRLASSLSICDPTDSYPIATL